MCECLCTNELIKWRSGQLIVLCTVYWYTCRLGNEVMCMNALECVCMYIMNVCVCKFVYVTMSSPVVFTSGDSSVVS